MANFREGVLLVVAGLFLLVLSVFTLYFLPTLIGAYRRKLNTLSIGVLNLLTGWTFIGWVVAIIWATTRDDIPLDERPIIITRRRIIAVLSPIAIIVVVLSVALADGSPDNESIGERALREAAHPDSPVSHCFTQLEEGPERNSCVDAYWDSLWMHPNLAAAQIAFGDCNDRLNLRYPDNAAQPTRKGITSGILKGGWRDPLPSKEEANQSVNEDIRGWNEANPGLDCQLAQ